MRIKNSIAETFCAMSQGNPGAIETLVRVYAEAKKVDNEDSFEGLGPIMILDHFNIYGYQICILANKICHGSLVHFLAVTRGLQLGILHQEEVYVAIEKGEPFSLPWVKLFAEIRKKVPNFNK
jgi:hypothetical protein